jgi:hypothetical protein
MGSEVTGTSDALTELLEQASAVGSNADSAEVFLDTLKTYFSQLTLDQVCELVLSDLDALLQYQSEVLEAVFQGDDNVSSFLCLLAFDVKRTGQGALPELFRDIDTVRELPEVVKKSIETHQKCNLDVASDAVNRLVQDPNGRQVLSAVVDRLKYSVASEVSTRAFEHILRSEDDEQMMLGACFAKHVPERFFSDDNDTFSNAFSRTSDAVRVRYYDEGYAHYTLSLSHRFPIRDRDVLAAFLKRKPALLAAKYLANILSSDAFTFEQAQSLASNFRLPVMRGEERAMLENKGLLLYGMPVRLDTVMEMIPEQVLENTSLDIESFLALSVNEETRMISTVTVQGSTLFLGASSRPAWNVRAVTFDDDGGAVSEDAFELLTNPDLKEAFPSFSYSGLCDMCADPGSGKIRLQALDRVINAYFLPGQEPPEVLPEPVQLLLYSLTETESSVFSVALARHGRYEFMIQHHLLDSPHLYHVQHDLPAALAVCQRFLSGDEVAPSALSDFILCLGKGVGQWGASTLLDIVMHPNFVIDDNEGDFMLRCATACPGFSSELSRYVASALKAGSIHPSQRGRIRESVERNGFEGTPEEIMAHARHYVSWAHETAMYQTSSVDEVAQVLADLIVCKNGVFPLLGLLADESPLDSQGKQALVNAICENGFENIAYDVLLFRCEALEPYREQIQARFDELSLPQKAVLMALDSTLDFTPENHFLRCEPEGDVQGALSENAAIWDLMAGTFPSFNRTPERDVKVDAFMALLRDVAPMSSFVVKSVFSSVNLTNPERFDSVLRPLLSEFTDPVINNLAILSFEKNCYQLSPDSQAVIIRELPFLCEDHFLRLVDSKALSAEPVVLEALSTHFVGEEDVSTVMLNFILQKADTPESKAWMSEYFLAQYVGVLDPSLHSNDTLNDVAMRVFDATAYSDDDAAEMFAALPESIRDGQTPDLVGDLLEADRAYRAMVRQNQLIVCPSAVPLQSRRDLVRNLNRIKVYEFNRGEDGIVMPSFKPLSEAAVGSDFYRRLPLFLRDAVSRYFDLSTQFLPFIEASVDAISTHAGIPDERSDLKWFLTATLRSCVLSDYEAVNVEDSTEAKHDRIRDLNQTMNEVELSHFVAPLARVWEAGMSRADKLKMVYMLGRFASDGVLGFHDMSMPEVEPVNGVEGVADEAADAQAAQQIVAGGNVSNQLLYRSCLHFLERYMAEFPHGIGSEGENRNRVIVVPADQGYTTVEFPMPTLRWVENILRRGDCIDTATRCLRREIPIVKDVRLMMS